MNLLPTQVDLKFAAPAAAIAIEAGNLVRGFYESGVETEYKGEADLVTEADRASERLIVERLHAGFPAMASMVKRARGTRWNPPTDGMSTRSTERRISPIATRSSAFRWDWNIVRRSIRR